MICRCKSERHWNGFVVKAAGSTTLNQSRTQNKVNEITAITASTGTDWADPVYDAAGNMTTMPKPSSLANSYTATYDAWNRMIQVKDGGTTIATYSYDGRNRRITADTGVVRHFYFTNSWQDAEERLGSLTTADRQYVWGIRYIDELICRDRLASSGSSSSSSSSGGGGLNERLYACQDANFNVTSLIDTSANVAERYTYDPYGTPTFRNASWADIGASAKASTILYAGYKYDTETGVYCVRNRYYMSQLGSWLARDAIEWAQIRNLFQYVSGQPTNSIDPLGLIVYAFSGINSPGDNYVSDQIKKYSHWRIQPEWEWWMHSAITIGTLLGNPLDTQKTLDEEAERNSANAPKGQCCDDTQPRKIRVIMVAPKTHQRPRPTTCCVFDIWVFWSDRDSVDNQRGFAQNNQEFWRQWGGEHTYNVDPGSEGLSNHDFFRYVDPTQPPTLRQRTGQGIWFTPDNATPLPKNHQPLSLIAEGMKQGVADDVIICHSQGCNIAWYSLNRACNR